MPRRKNKSRAGRGNAGVSRSRELPVTSLRYTGPPMPSISNLQDQTVTVLLHGNQVLTSSAGGVLSGVIALRNPSSCSGWSNLVATWDEFRTLSMTIQFVPSNQYDFTLATTTNAFLDFVDRDTSTVPTTTTTAQSYESCMIHSMSNTFKRLCYRMNSPEEAGFVNTAVPTNVKTGSFAWITVNTVSNSITYGYFYFSYLVQFRGLIS